MPTFSTFCLGTRKDADRWRRGMKEKLGFSEGQFIKAIEPTLADIEKFFKSKDDWLFLAGHFSKAQPTWSGWPDPSIERLYNDPDNTPQTPPTVEIIFLDDAVRVRQKSGGAWNEKTLRKDVEFLQHRQAKVVVWGGCNVCQAHTIATLRKLYGNVLIIGWTGTTGWEIIDIMMGGYGNASDPGGWRTPNFWDALGAGASDRGKVRDAWLKTANAIDWGPVKPPFCVVDPDGSTHSLAPIA